MGAATSSTSTYLAIPLVPDYGVPYREVFLIGRCSDVACHVYYFSITFLGLVDCKNRRAGNEDFKGCAVTMFCNGDVEQRFTTRMHKTNEGPFSYPCTFLRLSDCDELCKENLLGHRCITMVFLFWLSRCTLHISRRAVHVANRRTYCCTIARIVGMHARYVNRCTLPYY